jgi:predicted KAP-like P-loop ATPase
MFNPMILTEENDRTGALVKVEILKEILESNDEYLASENVISLYGGWGSGKSSVIESLVNKHSENKLNENMKILVFEAWKYENDQNLSLSLFEMLMDFKEEGENKFADIKKWGKREIKTLFGATKGLTKGTSFTLGIPAVVSVDVEVGKIMKEIEKIDDGYSMTSNYSKKKEVKDKYRNLIKELKGKSEKLIVFVDDLDRCENENILNLITSLKHIFSEAEDIIFVVAIDKIAVTQALKVKYGENSEKAEEYLEKVFPVSLSLPKEANLENYFEDFDKFDRKVVYQLLKKYGVITPRKLNKIINKMKMVTRFSELYKSITEKNEKGYYLNYLVFILILEETAPKHLKVFYEKINRLEITFEETELAKINQFVVDEPTFEEKKGTQYKFQLEKNPASKWGANNNNAKILTPQFSNMNSYINDINKYI